ncbi:MAG: lanthionine synthetase LanC family protein, partial [Stackebrandtia sp.]
MNPIPLAVADRLIDPTIVIYSAADVDAASLSHGLAGTALLHARLSAIDPRYATAAVQHWSTAATHLHDHPTDFNGIQGGRGGLAASFILGTPYLPEPNRCRPHAEQSAKWLAACATDLADHHTMRPPESGPQWHVYDAITGLTGIGRILLAADHNGHDVTHGLLSALHTLTDILAPRDNPRPGWWLTAEGHPPGPIVHPSGTATTGLAHGVAGPLALLATAHLAEWTVPGQTEAIAHAADWLLHWRHQDGTWPPAVTGTELDTDTT